MNTTVVLSRTATIPWLIGSCLAAADYIEPFREPQGFSGLVVSPARAENAQLGAGGEIWRHETVKAESERF